jgi:UDP-N-acetylglucosamine 3-dehydrogenase
MAKLNVAVIGVGNMGQHHARVYFEMPEANLIAVSDSNKIRGEEMAKKYNCLFYDDYKKMLEEQKIDAVSIAVPTFLHQPIAIDVLDRGVHVLLEKPIAANLDEARTIIEKAKQKNLKLMIGHIERFNPVIQKIKELIASGYLGDIISLNIKRVGGLPPQTKNANVVLDLGIHDIDISNYLLRENPQLVYGFKSKSFLEHVEDSGAILLKYQKAFSFIEVNWATPVKIRTLDITGTKAFIRADYIRQTISLYENNFLDFLRQNTSYQNFGEFISKFSQAQEAKIEITAIEPLRLELEHFIDCVLNDRQPLVGGEEAFKALEIALYI